MFAENPPRAASFKLACAWTMMLQLAAGYLAGSVFGIMLYLYLLSLVLAWIPIVVVEIRRRQKPSTTDLIVLYASYPVIFAAMFCFSRAYFGQIL